ncbi:uncharacterized protein LOC142355070, partial [Convolutriloba macropyga]|uniref:uncharacterized protein LOC142355070 n=1 Tax=Convolutriloba macropyga TaxID=536237 RepID=UPI003F52081C
MYYSDGIIYENGRPPSGKTTSSTDDPAMPEGYEGLEKMSEERKNTILTDNSIPMFQGTENTNNPTPVSPTVLTTQQSLATITTERNSSGGNGRRSLRQERFKKPAATVDDDLAQERGGTVRESDSFSTGSRSSTRENSPADRYSSDWDSSGRGSTMATSPGSLARNNRKKSGICRRPTLMVKQTLWVERDE